MKKLIIYINTIYRPAFLVLCIGLAIFSITMCILAVNMRIDMISGASNIIYKYPKMIEKVLFPLNILLSVIWIVDLNERKKEG